MGRITYWHVQFICCYYAQLWIAVLPPELVADGCDCDRIAGRRCLLNDSNHSCCRHEQCNHDENRNDCPCQFHLIASVHLGWLSAVVVPSLSELHDRVKQQGEHD